MCPWRAVFRRRSDDGIPCICVVPGNVAKGVWERVIRAGADETEIKRVLIDSAIVRVHRNIG